jgi:hypothetical protein
MKERPIIFTAESVRAILEGRKTQTRRVIIPQPDGVTDDGIPWIYKSVEVAERILMTTKFVTHAENGSPFVKRINCKYGVPGDRLWVREAWYPVPKSYGGGVHYRATDENDFLPGMKWKPSIHMPRLESRIMLEIVGIRVERVQEIKSVDTLAEGAPNLSGLNSDVWFMNEWNSINAKRGYSWESNPCVFVIEFEVMK